MNPAGKSVYQEETGHTLEFRGTGELREGMLVGVGGTWKAVISYCDGFSPEISSQLWAWVVVPLAPSINCSRKQYSVNVL